MRLFLASRFQNPNTIDTLQDYVHGLEGKKIAYIPTAANGENEYGNWEVKADGSYKFLQNLKAKVEPVVLEEYKNDSVIEKLEEKDIIWFAGGFPGYLMYWIRTCKIDLNIRRLLDSDTLYFGTSAGAMIAGQSIDAAAWDFVDEERGSIGMETMRLVDFDIFPHYRDELLPKIKVNYKGSKLYLLKDGEEIIVEDGKIEVIGEERIISNG